MLDRLEWQPLKSRRKIMRLRMMYKLYYGLVATDGIPPLDI